MLPDGPIQQRMSYPEPSTHDRFRERYLSGDVPWDHDDPPPEVIQLATELTPGRALDLGCGHGRAALHLARLGWTVDGVDFVAEAIEEARRRASSAGLQNRARFHIGDVTDLSDLTGPYDLAIDVGCSHRLPLPKLERMHDELLRVLSSTGRYVVFAKLHQTDQATDAETPWLVESELRRVFACGFRLDRAEHGTTGGKDTEQVPSAWFWFRRTGPPTRQ
jgi:cyclopropane fatty-acyl-phospholipid synthase-like methyltransferase